MPNGKAGCLRLLSPQAGPANGTSTWGASRAKIGRLRITLQRATTKYGSPELEAMLAERGLVSAEEIDAGRPLGEPKKVDGILQHGAVEAAFSRGRPTERAASVPARFRIGDRVRAKNIHPTTHTRLPRYVRGRPGTIERLCGCHVFPDTNALGQGENPQWLYTVRFDARDLWGHEADQLLKVSVDAWEPYLEPADQAP